VRLFILCGQLQRWIRFPPRNNDYSTSESIEALLYPLILSLGRIETTEPLRRDGVFQYLAALPHCPEATTVRRFLLRFATLGRDKLVSLPNRWRTDMLSCPKPAPLAILGLDTTVLTVYGCQEHSAVGFNPKKRGRRSYMPLLCFEGQSADVFSGSYHSGNTPPTSVTGLLLKNVLGKLPGHIRQVRVRTDAAFCDQEFVEFVEGKGPFYVIVARLTPRVKNRLGGLRYRRISTGVSAAELRYCPDNWKHPRRFVVIRRPVPEFLV
jgi:hypothetical protein